MKKVFVCVVLAFLGVFILKAVEIDIKSKNEKATVKKLPTKYELQQKALDLKFSVGNTITDEGNDKAEAYIYSVLKKTDSKTSSEYRFYCYYQLMSLYQCSGQGEKLVALGEELIHTFYQAAIWGKKTPLKLTNSVIKKLDMTADGYIQLGMKKEAGIIRARIKQLVILCGTEKELKYYEYLLKVVSDKPKSKENKKMESMFEK